MFPAERILKETASEHFWYQLYTNSIPQIYFFAVWRNAKTPDFMLLGWICNVGWASTCIAIAWRKAWLDLGTGRLFNHRIKASWKKNSGAHDEWVFGHLLVTGNVETLHLVTMWAKLLETDLHTSGLLLGGLCCCQVAWRECSSSWYRFSFHCRAHVLR